MAQDKTEIEVKQLEIITESYNRAMKEINALKVDIANDFAEKGTIIASNVAMDMARERYIIGGLYLTSNSGSKKKIITELLEKKKEKLKQMELDLKEEGETDEQRDSE